MTDKAVEAAARAVLDEYGSVSEINQDHDGIAEVAVNAARPYIEGEICEHLAELGYPLVAQMVWFRNYRRRYVLGVSND